jgi:hypothetical protein
LELHGNRTKIEIFFTGQHLKSNALLPVSLIKQNPFLYNLPMYQKWGVIDTPHIQIGQMAGIFQSKLDAQFKLVPRLRGWHFGEQDSDFYVAAGQGPSPRHRAVQISYRDRILSQNLGSFVFKLSNNFVGTLLSF